MNAHPTRLLPLLVLLAACDTVGAPLVDERSPPPEFHLPVGPCAEAAACDAPPPDAEHRAVIPAHVAPIPIDLGPCSAELRTRCMELAAEDWGVDAGNEGGPLSPEPDGCSTEPPALELGTLAYQALSCTGVELTLPAGTHEVAGLTLRNTNLTLRASAHATLILTGATLASVFVELAGPVTLRVHQPIRLDDVRTLAADGIGAGATLQVVDATARGLLAGSAPSLAIELDRARLDAASLSADTVVLESSSLTDSRIDARRVDGADALFERSTLATDKAVLSAFALRHSAIERCGQLTLLEGEAWRSSIAGCAGATPTRVYGSRMLDVAIDGAIESDESIWEYVRFGQHAPTDLLAFGGELLRGNFCAHAPSATLLRVVVRCTACDGWPPPPAQVCALPPEDNIPEPNFCPLLETPTPEACPLPLPQRRRPLGR